MFLLLKLVLVPPNGSGTIYAVKWLLFSSAGGLLRVCGSGDLAVPGGYFSTSP